LTSLELNLNNKDRACKSLNSALKIMTECKPATYDGKPLVLQGGGKTLPINFWT
jgi:hypothetical protein